MKAILASGICVVLATRLQPMVTGSTLPEWTQRLGWMLVHSIWQVTLIAAIAQIVSVSLRGRTAQTRYITGVMLLALMVIVPLVTARTIEVTVPVPTMAPDMMRADSELPASPATPLPMNLIEPVDRSLELADSPLGDPIRQPNLPELSGHRLKLPQAGSQSIRFVDATESVRRMIQPWLGCVVVLWLAGVVLCAARPLIGFWTQYRLQRIGLTEVSEEIRRQVEDLSRRLRMSTIVRVANSALVTVPMVVGYLKPIILLPASVVTGLTPHQLESLLAHELAHVRRHDWIVNAMQVLVETVLFYHPAVWWLSNRIRCDRELSCDDLALSVTRDVLTYGRMLLTLEELRHNHSAVVLAATDGDLTHRVQRLLGGHRSVRQSPRAWLPGIVLLGLLIASFVGWVTTSRSDANHLSAILNEPSSTKDEGNPANAESPKPSAVASSNEPPLLATDPLVVRGRVTMYDDSALPQDLKLQRRVTGSNFAEQVKDVEVDEHGVFEFVVQHEAAFVNLYAMSSRSAPGSAARFEVKRGQPIEPVVIVMPCGFTATLRLKANNGLRPTSGTATVSVRNSFEPILGVFSVAASGDVTIPHCPDGPVQIDLLMPGFEEQRTHRALSKSPVDLEIKSAATARFQLVHGKTGLPVSGAKVRLFSRVRAGSFLRPRQEWGDGPVWATSDVEGRVELKSLCQIDPVPTNDPGPCDYAFRIDAEGMARRYVGSVRAGSDLGQIVLTEALEIRGEIVPTTTPPERVSVQWRQRTIAQGGADDKQGWETASLQEVGGRLQLHLKGLQRGPLDLFVTFSDPKADPNSFAVVKQLEFHGSLQASSQGLTITRDEVKPGDEHLVATRASLFPIDEFPPSNVPKSVRQQLGFEPKATVGDDGNVTIAPPKSTERETIVGWSATAPVQHSMGHVEWRLFVLEDGTVIVPPRHNDAGAWHRLSPIQRTELTSLLDRYAEHISGQPKPAVPEQGGWRFGHETLQYTHNGKTDSFIRWHGPETPPTVLPDSNVKPPQPPPPTWTEVSNYLDRLIAEACSGGRAQLQSYRDLANQALNEAVKTATPFKESDWCSATIATDGTRSISFANLAENSRVDLEHPVGGQPYVRVIDFQQKRIPVPPKSSPAPNPGGGGQASRKSAIERVTSPVAEHGWGRKMLDPTPLDYGSITSGDESALTVRIKNVYREEIQITELTGAPGLDWQDEQNERFTGADLPIRLASGEERVLTLCLSTRLRSPGVWNAQVGITLLDATHEAADQVTLLVRADIRPRPSNGAEINVPPVSQEDLTKLKQDIPAYERVLSTAGMTEADQELIRRGIRYRLGMICQKVNAPSYYADFQRDLHSIDNKAGNRDAVAAFHQRVLTEVIAQIAPLMKTQNQLYARLQLTQLLGELNHASDLVMPDEPAKPFEPAAPLLIQILATPQEPLAIKVSAVNGLRRILHNCELDAAVLVKAAETLVNELKDQAKHDWYQSRVIQTLAVLDLSKSSLGNHALVVDVLKSVLADEKRDRTVRAEAARSLGRVQIPPSIDAATVTKAIVEFANKTLADAVVTTNVKLKIYQAFQPLNNQDLMADKKSKAGLLNNPSADARAAYDELMPRLRAGLGKR